MTETTVHRDTIALDTRGDSDILDLTDEPQRIVAESGVETGGRDQPSSRTASRRSGSSR